MDDIGSLANSCANHFEKLKQSLQTSGNEYEKQMSAGSIANEYARYRIWTGNLGALQRGRSSLDTRLRDSVILRAAVLKFLGQLRDSLISSAEITTGRRLPYEQTLISNMKTNRVDETDSEDNPNLMDTNSDTSSDSSVLELTERLGEIQDILNQLYKLSFKIRNTSYRSFNPKPLLFRNVDSQTGRDVFSAYATHDHRHVEEVFKHLRPLPAATEPDLERARPPNNDDVDLLDSSHGRLSANDFLQDRFAKAITNRRRYFAYWERHALKLGRVTDIATSWELTPKVAVSVDNVNHSLAQPIMADARGSLRPNTALETVVSETDHSAYMRKLDNLSETETIISYTTTAYDTDGRIAELPPPPIGAAKKSEFICPYCWVLCPWRQGQGKAWREHALQDLQPYVCTYEECSNADHLYNSRFAWLEHERLEHRRIWRCFEHPNFTTKTRDTLAQHYQDSHSGLDRQQVEQYLDFSETAMEDERRSCPVCLSAGPFNKGLHNHIAFHQEQLAIFALPRNDNELADVESERAQGARSLVSTSLHELDVSEGTGSLTSNLSVRGWSLEDVKLQEAIKDGDGKLVEDLLRTGAVQINVTVAANNEPRVRRSPLYEAAVVSHAGIVKLLLDAGADVDLPGGPFGNALQAAAMKEDVAMVQLLLKAGADVNLPGGPFGGALHAAAAMGNQTVVKVLLDAGADVNLQGDFFYNALQAAAAEGHPTVVKVLLDAGADVNAYGGYYVTALQAAAYYRRTSIVQLLLNAGADVNAGGGKHGSPLAAAAFTGDPAEDPRGRRGNLTDADNTVQLLRSAGAIQVRLVEPSSELATDSLEKGSGLGMVQPVRPKPPIEQFRDYMRPQLLAKGHPPEQIEDRIHEEWTSLSQENRELWDKRYKVQMEDYRLANAPPAATYLSLLPPDSLKEENSSDASALRIPHTPKEEFYRHVKAQLVAHNYPADKIEQKLDAEWFELSSDIAELWVVHFEEQMRGYERQRGWFEATGHEQQPKSNYVSDAMSEQS